MPQPDVQQPPGGQVAVGEGVRGHVALPRGVESALGGDDPLARASHRSGPVRRASVSGAVEESKTAILSTRACSRPPPGAALMRRIGPSRTYDAA